MCGRYTLYADMEEIKRAFSLKDVIFDYNKNYNVAPTTVQPVIVDLAGSLRALCMMKWDLTPPWQNAKKAPLINARVESLDENKPSFRTAIKDRRCLVITNGFYEWKIKNGLKYPYFITLKDKKPFAFAGIWERNLSKDPMDSFAIITVPANEAVRPLHDRMPAILNKEDYSLWLDPSVREWSAVKHLIKTYPEDDMLIHPVTRKMNNARYVGSDAIESLSTDETFNGNDDY